MKKFKKANKIYKFKNGATLIYRKSEIKGYKGTSVFAGFSRGSKFDTTSGIMHFLEHQLFCGSEKYTKKDLFVKRNEIALNGATSFDGINMNALFSNRICDENFDLLSDCLLHPKFTQENIDNERGVIHEEISGKEKNIERNIMNLHKLLFVPNYDSTSDTIGTHESIDKITLQDLQTLHERNFRAEYFVMAVCTNLPFWKIKKLTKKHFTEKLLPAEKVEENDVVFEYTKANAMKVYTNNKQQVECAISFCCDVGRFSCNNLTAYDRVTRTFEIDDRSIYDELRDRGFIYGFRTEISVNDQTSAFLFVFDTNKENFVEALNVIGEHLHYAFNNPLTKEKFEKIKKQEKLKDDINYFGPRDPRRIARGMFGCFCQNYEQQKINTKRLKKKQKIEDINQLVHAFFSESARIQISIRGDITEEKLPTYQQIRDILVGGLKD